MANVLKMELIKSVLSLHAQRWSQRWMARALQIDRETVRKTLRERLPSSKPAIGPAGAERSKPATFPGAPAAASKPASNLPTVSKGRRSRNQRVWLVRRHSHGPLSRCESLRETILAKSNQGLSWTRIWQDLFAEHRFQRGYDSVRRFIQKLGRIRSLPSAGWNAVLARKRKSTSADAPVVTPDG